MDSLDYVRKAYKIGWYKRKYIMCCKDRYYKDKYDELKKMEIYKKWPKITVADDPDNI
jgi:hypothetical protein